MNKPEPGALNVFIERNVTPQEMLKEFMDDLTQAQLNFNASQMAVILAVLKDYVGYRVIEKREKTNNQSKVRKVK